MTIIITHDILHVVSSLVTILITYNYTQFYLMTHFHTTERIYWNLNWVNYMDKYTIFNFHLNIIHLCWANEL